MIKCCKDCKERYLACHDSCVIYQNEKAKDEEIKKKRQLDCEYTACAKKLSIERKRKWLRRK